MNLDCLLNPIGCATDKVVEVTVKDAVSGVFADVATWLLKGTFEILSTIASWWVVVDTPRVATACIPGKGGGCDASGTAVLTELRGHFVWITMFVLVVTLMISAGKMIWHRDGRPAADALRAILTTVLVSVAGVMLMDMLIRFGDRYATWIINQATSGEGVTWEIALNGSAIGIYFMAGLLGLLTNITMVILLAARSTALIFFAAALPIAAASSGTAWGKQWFDKMVGWVLAFILFKPVAASVYALSFLLMKNGEPGDPMTVLMVLAAAFMAVLALPALVKLFVPATAGLSGGGAGSGAMAAGMAASSLMRMGGPKGAAVMRMGGPKGAAGP